MPTCSQWTLQLTDSYGFHDSTAAPIAVSGHYADSVNRVVGYSWQWSTGCSSSHLSGAWTDSDGVAYWCPATILWGLPLYCKRHIVLTVLPDSVRGCTRRWGKTCKGKQQKLGIIKMQNLQYYWQACIQQQGRKWIIGSIKWQYLVHKIIWCLQHPWRSMQPVADWLFRGEWIEN